MFKIGKRFCEEAGADGAAEGGQDGVDVAALQAELAALKGHHEKLWGETKAAKAKAKVMANANPKLAEKIMNQMSPDTKAVVNKSIYIQSAAFWYVPFLIILSIISWFYLRSIPMHSSIKEQMDIFGNKHTWYCTITYVMTFGTFAGLSAAFPARR